jgi:hypothetical protein
VDKVFDECVEIVRGLDRGLFGLEVVVNYP